jgi:hypothetical protein
LLFSFDIPLDGPRSLVATLLGMTKATLLGMTKATLLGITRATLLGMTRAILLGMTFSSDFHE